MNRAVVYGGVMLIVGLTACSWGVSADTDEAEPDLFELLGANAACYVCHIPFVQEELGMVHLKAQVPCFKCHGISAGHANDEDIGATKPDIVFSREKIDASCIECHETHDATARAVVARFVERKLSPDASIVCIDCHGTHKIEPPPEEEEGIVSRLPSDAALK